MRPPTNPPADESRRPDLRRACAAASLAIALLGATGDVVAPVRPVTDIYFGIAVTDPYRYMESNDPDYIAWKSAQLASTRAMLVQARAKLGTQAPIVPVPRVSYLTTVRGHAFFERTIAGHDELVTTDMRGGDERTITTGVAGTFGALSVSPDARLIAFHVYSDGIAESDMRIISVATGRDVEEPIHQTIYDYTGFTADGKSVVYASTPKHTQQENIPDIAYDYLHTIGSPQRSDRITLGQGVSPRVNVPRGAFAFVDFSGPIAVAEVRDVAAGGSRFYAAPATSVGKPGTPWRPLGTEADGFTDYAVHGTAIDFATNNHAPNYAVVRASLVGPFVPRVVLAPSPENVVSGTLDGIPKAGIFALNAARDADYVQLLVHGMSRMVRIPYDKHPVVEPVPLPLAGSILQTAADASSNGTLVDLTSWSVPGDVYDFDPRSGATVATGMAKRTAYAPRVAEEITAVAGDGTPIPISIVHQPGIALDGSHPLMLRVAGAYGFSLTPDYRTPPEAWLALGGIYAVAHIRGGGEFGEDWHRAGMAQRKSNSWNDLIVCAQKLIDAGYTSPKRLDLYGTTQSYLGGVASGIVIGRAIEERPNLFAAAVVDQADMDMVRSERTGLGKQSISEFGSVTTRAGFDALRAMSPYEHVAVGTAYPPLLIRSFANVGIGDDWQSAKFVARVQAASPANASTFFDSVHADPADKRRVADLRMEAYAFLLAEDSAL